MAENASPWTTSHAERDRETLERIWAVPKGWRILSAVNNTAIGYFYVGAAFLFFLLAGVLALLMRTQLAVPEQHLPQPRYLQPDLHHARHGDDVPVCGAGGRGDGHPAAAADARRARPAVPAAGRLRLLGVFHRRPGLLQHALLRPRARPAAGSCTRRSPARATRPASAPISGCSASASSRSRRSRAPSRSSSACCARARRA